MSTIYSHPGEDKHAEKRNVGKAIHGKMGVYPKDKNPELIHCIL